MEKSPRPAPIVSVISSIAKVTGSIPQLQEDLQTWFNEYMARVSGWYKKSFNIRLGWSHEFIQEEISGSTRHVFNRIVWLLMGWLLSAAALSKGAPFWFDVLGKLVNIRRAGAKPK